MRSFGPVVAHVIAGERKLFELRRAARETLTPLAADATYDPDPEDVARVGTPEGAFSYSDAATRNPSGMSSRPSSVRNSHSCRKRFSSPAKSIRAFVVAASTARRFSRRAR